MVELTHANLSQIAMRWLKRPFGSKGPGCKLSLIEVGGVFNGERADAFGYRYGSYAGSVVVEVKVSRSDFLIDAKKPHRNGEVLGMGNYRYYMCPEGIINKEDLPEGWGLLWVNSRGHVKVICGHVEHVNSWHAESKRKVLSWRQEANSQRELQLMAHLLERIGDPQALNAKFREMASENSRLIKKCNEQQEKMRGFFHQQWKIQALEAELAEVKAVING